MLTFFLENPLITYIKGSTAVQSIPHIKFSKHALPHIGEEDNYSRGKKEGWDEEEH